MQMNMDENFEVMDRLIHFYAERARGGASMIAVDYATVNEMSKRRPGKPALINFRSRWQILFEWAEQRGASLA